MWQQIVSPSKLPATNAPCGNRSCVLSGTWRQTRYAPARLAACPGSGHYRPARTRTQAASQGPARGTRLLPPSGMMIARRCGPPPGEPDGHYRNGGGWDMDVLVTGAEGPAVRPEIIAAGGMPKTAVKSLSGPSALEQDRAHATENVVLRASRGHSACCRPPTSMPVDPVLTALWPEAEAPDCTVLHCRTWIAARGSVLTFRLTSCQNPGARTS